MHFEQEFLHDEKMQKMASMEYTCMATVNLQGIISNANSDYLKRIYMTCLILQILLLLKPVLK